MLGSWDNITSVPLQNEEPLPSMSYVIKAKATSKILMTTSSQDINGMRYSSSSTSIDEEEKVEIEQVKVTEQPRHPRQCVGKRERQSCLQHDDDNDDGAADQQCCYGHNDTGHGHDEQGDENHHVHRRNHHHHHVKHQKHHRLKHDRRQHDDEHCNNHNHHDGVKDEHRIPQKNKHKHNVNLPVPIADDLHFDLHRIPSSSGNNIINIRSGGRRRSFRVRRRSSRVSSCSDDNVGGYFAKGGGGDHYAKDYEPIDKTTSTTITAATTSTDTKTDGSTTKEKEKDDIHQNTNQNETTSRRRSTSVLRTPNGHKKLSGSILRRRSCEFGGKRHSSGSGGNNATNAGYQNRKLIWSNLVKDERVWDEDTQEGNEDQEKPTLDTKTKINRTLHNLWITTRIITHNKKFVLQRHPWIVIVTFSILGGILAIGLYGVYQLIDEHEKASRDEAHDLAVETGSWFTDALDSTLLPLFTLSQFVQQLDMFATLPEQIGSAFEKDSLPFLPPNDEGEYTHRNITGSICENSNDMAQFAKLAATIKNDAQMEGILINLQVAPCGTVCYVHPLINTEDFTPPNYLDSTPHIGHDLLNDPQRKFLAQSAILIENDVVIAGPLPLRENLDREAFIAYMAIDGLSKNHVISVDGIEYNKWGFAVALIDWNELVRRSDIDERFAARGMLYQLTRTDRNYNEGTKTFDVKVNVLAGEENFELNEGDYVSIDLDTTNNLWNIKVGYEEGFTPSWKNGAIAGTVVGAIILSFMFMVICIENQTRHDLLREMLPPKALRKIKKGKTCVEKYDSATVFFSDIVGYTSMSAEMSAIQVMKLLNDFYTEVDKIASKWQVYKIQTIGDAYMVTGGVSDCCQGPEGANKVALFAIETMEFAKNFRTSDGAKVIIRAGINSGPLVAGVVGTKRPQYTVFGETVNAAARMESTSDKMRIQCSDMTYRLLRESTTHVFNLEKRDMYDVNEMYGRNTWFINGAKRLSAVACEDEDSAEENDGDAHLYDDLG